MLNHSRTPLRIRFSTILHHGEGQPHQPPLGRPIRPWHSSGVTVSQQRCADQSSNDRVGCGVTLAGKSGSGESPRITAFTGRFGSGKTEIALNYALQLAGQGQSPFLIDLDIVTPYFRVRDRVDEMSQNGVEVVTPFAVGQYLDTPAIHPRILGTLEQTARPVVLDVGGDEQGARALAQYTSPLTDHSFEMMFVINPYRPFMNTPAGIQAAVREIEASSRLTVSALVSNPNLMSETTPTLFAEGHHLVEQTSRALNLPIALVVTSESLSGQMDLESLGLPVLVIHRYFVMFDSG